MELTAADFALFLHIFFVIAALCLAAVLHAGLLLLRAARDVAAIRAWPRVVRALGVALPLIALLILLTGAWLLQLSNGEFSWEQGWVTASLVGLVCAEAAGAVAGSRSAALRRAINEAPDGPVGADLRRRILDPVLWCILHGGTAIFLAVVFVMVVKPPGLWSAVVIAAVGLLGALSGVPFSRTTRTGRRASAAGHVAAREVSGVGTYRRAPDPDT
jgi:predicted integral membrane protein DUF2269